MRIVHLILTRRFAGSERYAVELANAQARNGHQVHMILRNSACDERADAIAHRLDKAVHVERVGDWFPVWQARRKVRQLRPDVAHAHLNKANRALHGLKGICLRVSTLHIEYKPRQHDDLDALIAIAPWQLTAVPEHLRPHCVQIDNWTQHVDIAPETRSRLRQSLGIDPGAFVFGTLGRIEDGKGLDIVLAAWQRAALPASARLMLVGQGAAFESIRKAAPAEVIMPGFVSRPREWMAAFDVFVSAARREPFGLVFLEAMDAGLPILASATDGARHLAPVIGTPLLPINDVDALANAFREAFEARWSRREYAMQRFDLDARVADVEAFYQRERQVLKP